MFICPQCSASVSDDEIDWDFELNDAGEIEDSSGAKCPHCGEFSTGDDWAETQE